MSEKSLTSIKNRVITTLIVSFIIFVLNSIWVHHKKVIDYLLSFSFKVGNLIFGTHNIYGWALFILFTLAIIGAVSIYKSIKKKKIASFNGYVEDQIFGAFWRWSWIKNRICNLWCYCPHCDCELVYDDSSCRDILSNISKTKFICENCSGTTISEIKGGGKEYAISAVRREIERRVRNGIHI